MANALTVEKALHATPEEANEWIAELVYGYEREEANGQTLWWFNGNLYLIQTLPGWSTDSALALKLAVKYDLFNDKKAAHHYAITRYNEGRDWAVVALGDYEVEDIIAPQPYFPLAICRAVLYDIATHAEYEEQRLRNEEAKSRLSFFREGK